MLITLIQVPEDLTYEQKFHVGKSYKDQTGKIVHIKEDNFHKWKKGSPYRCVRGHDGAWRYCHSGRVCGTAHDFSYPKNLVGNPVNPKEKKNVSTQSN